MFQATIYALVFGIASGWFCKLVGVSRRFPGVHWKLFPLVFGTVQALFFSALFYCLGHEFLACARNYVSGGSIYLVPSESCCTPAVFFDAKVVPQFSDFLNAQRVNAAFHKDHMLDEFGGSRARMVDLDVVQHIGRYSSLRGGDIRLLV
ncbi:unnamed protein product [Sphagnum balticum]